MLDVLTIPFFKSNQRMYNIDLFSKFTFMYLLKKKKIYFQVIILCV
jgi:hypothetical protein